MSATNDATGTRVYVGNIPSHAPKKELEDLLCSVGKVQAFDHKEGFTFVEYVDQNGATDAVRYNINGLQSHFLFL